MLLSRLLTDFSLTAGVGQEGGEFVLNEKVEELRLQSYEHVLKRLGQGRPRLMERKGCLLQTT
ncbi:MAG: hypothetical protein AAGK82_11595, partial [Pseudomonadota bacterium]